jgi:carbohydrate-selective porin OprB
MRKVFVIFIIIFLVVLIISSFSFFYFKRMRGGNYNISAKDSEYGLTTKVQWDTGLLDNIISGATGDVSIDNKALIIGNKIDISSATIVANPETNKTNPLDSIFCFANGWFSGNGEGRYWLIDLGAEYKARVVTTDHIMGSIDTGYSTDGINWHDLPPSSVIDPDVCGDGLVTRSTFQVVTLRYFRYMTAETGYYSIGLAEFELYEPDMALATHTTAPTQIDGQEGSDDKTLIQWTSFTPTQTVPENTTATYQFRTSDNASDWTAWTGDYTYSGDPIDLTGLDDDRYLQVKATLSNTDGVSSPQIDDYTINFHNNQKPNQPTAQTAIIGD